MKTPFTGLTMLTKREPNPWLSKKRSRFQLLQGQPGPLTWSKLKNGLVGFDLCNGTLLLFKHQALEQYNIAASQQAPSPVISSVSVTRDPPKKKNNKKQTKKQTRRWEVTWIPKSISDRQGYKWKLQEQQLQTATEGWCQGHMLRDAPVRGPAASATRLRLQNSDKEHRL